MELDAAGCEPAPYAEPALATLLLALCADVPAGGRMVVRTRCLAGGDAELVVEGLPQDAGARAAADLRAICDDLLERWHRARLVQEDGRLRLLLPARDRAAVLREAARSSRRTP